MQSFKGTQLQELGAQISQVVTCVYLCQLDQGCIMQHLNPVLLGVNVSEFALLHCSSGKRKCSLIVDLDLDQCLEQDPKLITHI